MLSMQSRSLVIDLFARLLLLVSMKEGVWSSAGRVPG